jgi:hypothetical protein
MNDPLFKQLGEELSPEEESEFTRRLAAAYREHEASERRPEVERIAKLIRERFEGAGAASGGESNMPDEP